MNRVFVGIGSNEGDRLRLISRAVRELGALPGIRIVQMAMVAETEPVGPPQAPYLNTVVELATALDPLELLRMTQAIERRLGRVPSPQRWGPRPIDLDILLYHDRTLRDAHLRLPHPRMHERRFVLEPLAQLAPELVHPVLRRSIAELLARLPP